MANLPWAILDVGIALLTCVVVVSRDLAILDEEDMYNAGVRRGFIWRVWLMQQLGQARPWARFLMWTLLGAMTLPWINTTETFFVPSPTHLP
jgi:hypothetical protein